MDWISWRGYFTIMGIAEFPVATLTANRATAILRRQKQPGRLRGTFHISPLWVCLLIALVLRVWLTVRTHGVIDGDEAMVGIQAEHILRGEHPTYFYGQVYMGSLEAYLVAILFKIAGPSVWTLRAEPILLSLVVVWLSGKLAQALSYAAKLPASAKQCFIATATLFAAVSPVYDTVLELRTLGGYIETFVLMLALLLSAFRLTQRWHEGAASSELALRWAGIGFCLGLGLWVDPLIASAVLTVALWIAGYCMGKKVRFKRLLLAVAAIPAFLLGALPVILWGATHRWANVSYLLQSVNQPVNTALQQHYPTRLDVVGAMAWFYGNTMLARLIGGATPGEDAISATLHTGTTLIGLLCVCMTLVLVAGSFFLRQRMIQCVRQLVMLPLLFGICSAAVFCTSLTATSALLTPQHDVAGRYATPLMLVLPFFFATAITGVMLWINAGRAGRDVKGDGRDKSAPTVAWIVQGILLVLLLFSLGMQSASYGMVNPAATFQSPSCPIAPANNDPIIAYLQKEHVHYAWAVPWIGNPITFKTDDGIITADPRPLINFIQITRINAYLRDVSLANRPAILTFVPHNDPYPLLLWILDTKHITYRAAYFPSEPGTDVLVVTELSRTISLYMSPYMRDVFGNCI
jgi:hypothetical protein